MKHTVKTECIEKMQKNLKLLRTLSGLSQTDLGDILCVTKQAVSALECGYIDMSMAQYIALRSIFEHLSVNGNVNLRATLRELFPDENWLDDILTPACRFSTETRNIYMEGPRKVMTIPRTDPRYKNRPISGFLSWLLKHTHHKRSEIANFLDISEAQLNNKFNRNSFSIKELIILSKHCGYTLMLHSDQDECIRVDIFSKEGNHGKNTKH